MPRRGERIEDNDFEQQPEDGKRVNEREIIERRREKIKPNKADTRKEEEKAGDWLWSPARRKKGFDYEHSWNKNSNPSDYLALVCLQLQHLGYFNEIDFGGELVCVLALMLRGLSLPQPAQLQNH